jgi:hypothetical protein
MFMDAPISGFLKSALQCLLMGVSGTGALDVGTTLARIRASGKRKSTATARVIDK